MQILIKLFVFLINIDQETVLNFFGIEDPTSYLSFGIEVAPVSKEISLETLKLIFQGLLERYQYGLGLVDIENILLFITVIRFIIFANKYNIKTSFYICCISLFAGFLWYTHLKDLLHYYGEVVTSNRLTTKFGEDGELEDYIMTGKRQNQMFLPFLNQNPLNFFVSAVVNSFEKDGYRIDPVSMLVARIPEVYKLQVENWYYYLYGNLLPSTWKIIQTQIRELGTLILYVIIVRVNKKYCPYLIRWHWTFLVVSSIVESEYIRIFYRFYYYNNFVLIPSNRVQESALLEQLFALSVTVHYFLVCLGMLHAICGQYFYIPFLVENTEIHIGKRSPNSIYSGGFTSWQDGGSKQIEIMAKNRRLFMFPRLWWGWLGKDKKNINEYTYKKRQQNRLKQKRNKGFKNLIRKLKKWIFKN